MTKQFKTAITSIYDQGDTTERNRDKKLAEMVRRGYTLFSTTASDRHIVDTYVGDDEKFVD